MPKKRTGSAVAVTDAPPTPIHGARDAADALYRAASECCHQHDRMARVLAKSNVEDELRSAQALCAQCTDALAELVAAYEQAAGAVHPTGSDAEWWHRANALWLASREYLRRDSCCDKTTRELRQHDRERLGALHTDYELEASAVLALRHAADAYGRSRPVAH